MGLERRPFTVEELAANSERVVGSPVLLLPFESPPRGDGAVFAVAGRYVICFRANTDELHRRHIIMHELAHVYLGHHGTISDGWFVSNYEDEQEANLLADQLVARSLGIQQPRSSRLLDWLRRHLGSPAGTEQERLRSFFE